MKLICLDDSRNEFSKHFENWINLGEIYTVRRIEGSLYQCQRVLLKEVKNPPVFIEELAGRFEPGFNLSRFLEVSDEVLEAVEKEEVEITV